MGRPTAKRADLCRKVELEECKIRRAVADAKLTFAALVVSDHSDDVARTHPGNEDRRRYESQSQHTEKNLFEHVGSAPDRAARESHESDPATKREKFMAAQGSNSIKTIADIKDQTG